MLGDRLKKLRSVRGLSQEELSKYIGLTRGTYAHYEINKRQPDYDTLQKLADFFDVSTDYLLGRTENKKNEVDDRKEMMEFFNNPRLNLFFKEMADSPEEQLEELQEFWEIIKKRGLHKK